MLGAAAFEKIADRGGRHRGLVPVGEGGCGS
jgi:hypothetical protein